MTAATARKLMSAEMKSPYFRMMSSAAPAPFSLRDDAALGADGRDQLDQWLDERVDKRCHHRGERDADDDTDGEVDDVPSHDEVTESLEHACSPSMPGGVTRPVLRLRATAL
jgi:hypothetical protein